MAISIYFTGRSQELIFNRLKLAGVLVGIPSGAGGHVHVVPEGIQDEADIEAFLGEYFGDCSTVDASLCEWTPDNYDNIGNGNRPPAGIKDLVYLITNQERAIVEAVSLPERVYTVRTKGGRMLTGMPDWNIRIIERRPNGFGQTAALQELLSSSKNNS